MAVTEKEEWARMNIGYRSTVSVTQSLDNNTSTLREEERNRSEGKAFSRTMVDNYYCSLKNCLSLIPSEEGVEYS